MNVKMQARFAMSMPHAQILLAATSAPVTLGLKEMEHVVMVYISCHNRSKSRTGCIKFSLNKNGLLKLL